ncbi:hypothetical protein EW145_g8636, partial [Phellinidium pouzarii]
RYIVANLASKAGCDALVEEFKKRESKLHILVNNSGVTWGAPYDSFPEKDGWDRVLALNVKSIFYMTAGYVCFFDVCSAGLILCLFIRLLRVGMVVGGDRLTDLLAQDATSTDPGRVINISSVAGVDAHAEGSSLADKGMGLWSYNTSKAAVVLQSII